ncbi:MAG: amidohydrolase family protein [Chloroflexi bacterium]|nr:amidohydrolase family protein [Chloroflexota bacterium]
MLTNLAHYIQQTPLCDTHEHLEKETGYVEKGPDLLQNLFGNYVSADLVVAGASQAAVDTLLNPAEPDIVARFNGVRAAWEAVRHTGYGEAVRIIARELYAIEEISPATLEAAQSKHAALRQPGQRLHLLRDKANLDHVQVDDFALPCLPDPSGVDFFFYDISWVNFCKGTPELDVIAKETGIQVSDLATLRQAMEAIFEKYARYAIAIKSQHAYNRTLFWSERTDAEAAQALTAYLQKSATEADQLCLGDWCWARGVELGIAHDLPFKLHTGYYAGHSRMPVDYIRAGNLCALLAKYPQARFVLMHIAYPYNDELVALAKHYPNVYVDMCWAWSIDPYTAGDFVRRWVHTVPANKLFIFGGDTFWAGGAVAYAYQARQWFTRALQAEIDQQYLTENEAIQLAGRFMHDNQYACFHIEEKKQILRNASRTL